MKPIYLFKAFFFLCSILFASNVLESLNSHIFMPDTLFQTFSLAISLFLTLSIRIPHPEQKIEPIT